MMYTHNDVQSQSQLDYLYSGVHGMCVCVYVKQFLVMVPVVNYIMQITFPI